MDTEWPLNSFLPKEKCQKQQFIFYYCLQNHFQYQKYRQKHVLLLAFLQAITKDRKKIEKECLRLKNIVKFEQVSKFSGQLMISDYQNLIHRLNTLPMAKH